MTKIEFSIDQARTLAIAATGLNKAAQFGAEPKQVLTGLGLIQIDSVNYFQRSHYLPIFSRSGEYRTEQLDELVFDTNRKELGITEYWAHEASLIPVTDLPLLRWRMANFKARKSRTNDWAKQNPQLFQAVKAELKERGPLLATEISLGQDKKLSYWSTTRSEAKQALETLFNWGEVVVSGREGFSRRYALPEQVLPKSVLDSSFSEDEALKQLIVNSINYLGIGTVADIADYYRIKPAEVRRLLPELLEDKKLIRVRVSGWPDKQEVYLSAKSWKNLDSELSTQSNHSALLSPFDPLVWNRDRAERLFNFFYRIEIYLPPP